MCSRQPLSASYTVNDSEIVENASNPTLVSKQLTNAPRRQGSLRADWSLAGGARLYARVNHVGDQQYDGVGYIAPGSVVTAGIDARF